MRTLFVVLLSLSVCSLARAAENDQDGWQYTLTPYLWLPTISANLNFQPPAGGGAPSVDAGPTDWLKLLNGAALLSGSVSNGAFSLHGDFIWLSLESDDDKVVGVRDGVHIPVDASLNLSTETDFDGLSWTLAAGYMLQQTERSSVEILGGVRYFGMDVETSWNLELDIESPNGGVALPAQGSIGDEVKLWDGIVGVRGHVAIGDGRWYVPYYLDVGTGDTDLTWQAMTGLSYSYGWGDLMLVYRHLDYDEGADKLLDSLALSGPAFGARFRFQ
ncbi:MAG TPA: hypothetical protein PKK10_04305 [Woeseiaceae bacterium]|nr:hypothetical protein [Woeseiaceae bacterium]